MVKKVQIIKGQKEMFFKKPLTECFFVESKMVLMASL